MKGFIVLSIFYFAVAYAKYFENEDTFSNWEIPNVDDLESQGDGLPVGHKTMKRSVGELPHNDLFIRTKECRPGMAFILECNRCHCTQDGKDAFCTAIGCPTPQKPRIDGYRSGEACIPGETFFDVCNECLCDPSGRDAVCAMMDC